MKLTTDVEFYKVYTDRVTGFEGAATGVNFFSNGCIRIELTRADKDGKPESIWFDEQDLESVTPHAITGGPRDHDPIRRDAP